MSQNTNGPAGTGPNAEQSRPCQSATYIDSVKTFTQHGPTCSTQAPHSTGKALAHCQWPSSSVRGSGTWAVVTRCSGVRVRLYRYQLEAEHELTRANTLTCCLACLSRHELVKIADDLAAGL